MSSHLEILTRLTIAILINILRNSSIVSLNLEAITKEDCLIVFVYARECTNLYTA
jgi:hypothetical protein